MKSVLGLALLILTLVLVSFRPDYSIDDITGAMRSGNINTLSRYLDSRVDISLPEKSDTYSKSQAEMIIRDFFNTNVVRNFFIKNKGENGGSEFCIGLLQTRNGDYRTTLFIKQKGDKLLLQELRFQACQ
ncbi:MAG: hypothetical protein BGO55_28245 [Sphingobacteriales bacterium 50-39]|nr:DUF4783 domain-containing protein [Sphingobacteriales bacterium]OJW56921.1 MAG: hypothetical protein BGO55_28245 [Sphingobacteriales bacterium 50-39]